MHLFLTDRLACPRCGPEFGLILLAHDVRSQRIFRGDLGCPNCRQTYPVEEGFGDLRFPPEGPLPEEAAAEAEPAPEESIRVAAFLGVTDGPGLLLLRGPVAGHARGLSEMLEEVEVVAVDGSLRGEEERPGVSRMVAGRRLPFFSGTFRAVCLSGGWTPDDLDEGGRVVAPLGRLVALDAPGGTGERMAGMGLELLLDQDGVVVGRKARSQPLPLTTLRVP